jgi:ribosomal protein L34E
MNPICKIWAHKYEDHSYNSPYGIFKCKRCGTETDYNEDYDAGSLNLASKLWRKWTRIKDWFYRKTSYFQKCHDCGKRWNKHDESCPPF